MGSVNEVKDVFDDSWDWSNGGEEWSAFWGGTPALWYGVLLPRMHAFLPAERVLEIAPGYGRWTHYLKELGSSLTLVDLAASCIDACRARFAADTNIEYHVNDGRSLAMVEDNSVDFAFSWDSLVHAEAAVLDSYLEQLAQKLSHDGVGFLHHSNAAAYPRAGSLAVRVPERLRRPLVHRGVLLDVYAWRAPDVSAAQVSEMCRRHGLSCLSQELFTWEHGPFLTEAVTVFARPGSRWEGPTRLARNWRFRQDALLRAKLYSGSWSARH